MRVAGYEQDTKASIGQPDGGSGRCRVFPATFPTEQEELAMRWGVRGGV